MDQAEKDILSGIRKSDPKAFEELFRIYYSTLINYSISILKDDTLANDAVQSVFIHIWERRTDLPSINNIRAYLYRATYNGSLNLIKQNEVNEKARQGLSLIHPGIEQSFLLDIEAKEMEERITAAVAALPQKCREVFELSRINGLKNREVASQLGISIKTVEAQLSKALKIIKEKLAHEA